MHPLSGLGTRDTSRGLALVTVSGWTAMVSAAVLISIAEAIRPAYVHEPGAQAIVSATVVISAAAGGLLLECFALTHRTRDLMLFLGVALMTATYLTFAMLPSLIGQSQIASRTAPQLACEAGVAVAFAAAALTARARRAAVTARTAAAWTVVGGLLLLCSWMVVLLIRGSPPPDLEPEPRIAESLHHPGALVVVLLSTGLLVLSAVAYTRRGRRHDADGFLLAGAVALLASAGFQHLSVESVRATWLTPAEGMRLVVACLLLIGAYRQYLRQRRSVLRQAVVAERDRIARDMHDGFVQDLAFIASRGEVLAAERGSEDPVTVAAQRALDSARRALGDLGPSRVAPTVAAALQDAVAELRHRFAIDVQMCVDPDAETRDLDGAERHELVRILREAIVNAVTHGRARHIVVELAPHEHGLVMRVRDDGSGIAATITPSKPGTGLGLGAMKARAERLNGRLVAGPGAEGGTEVELVIP